MRDSRPLSVRSLLVGCTILFLTVECLHSATIQKANNADDLNFPSSWIGLVVPGPNDIAQWSGSVTGATTVNLGANMSWLGIKISDPGGLTTINPGHSLMVGPAGVDLSTATTSLTLNCPMVLSSQTWAVAGGQKAFFGGIVSGSGIALMKTGAGEVQLAATNSFSGTVGVAGGKLILSAARGLGFASASVNAGAQLEVATSGTFTNALTIAGDGSDNQGALNFNGLTATWSGPITLAGDARIGSYGSSGNYTFSGGITGPGTVRFWGGGASRSHQHTYSLSGPCTHSGDTQIDTWAASTTVLLSGGDNRLPVTGAMALLAGVWNGQYLSATLKLNGQNQAIGGLNSGSGTHGSGGTNRVVNGHSNAATLTISNSVDNVFDGFLGGPGVNDNNFGLVKNGSGSLAVRRTASYRGPTMVNRGDLFLFGGLGGGPAAVGNNAGLILGMGPWNLSGLTLSPQSRLGVYVGAPGDPSNTVLHITGNLTLDGSILVQEAGGAAPLQLQTVIYYTGTLTNNGMVTDPRSSWEVQVDTSIPGQVKLRLLQPRPMAMFTTGNLHVTTTSTNLSGVLHGYPALPLWYEVRDSLGLRRDFGSTLAVTPWSITVRHLREGVNRVTVFAKDQGGNTLSNSLTLTLSPGPNPSVRPRPVPAEIWWGGSCHDNLYNAGGSIIGTYSRMEQLTNSAGWDFVKRYQDGFLLHGYVWVNDIARMTNWVRVGREIATQLASHNGKFWLEAAWRPRTNDMNYGRSSVAGQNIDIQDLLALGIPVGEITMDFNPMYREFSTWRTDWPTNDIRVLGTGNMAEATPDYPYPSGQWRDFAGDFRALRPDVQFGWTWSPVWFHWSNGPSLGTDHGIFTLTYNSKNYSFNWDFYNWMADAAVIGEQVGVPFAFASDCPWDYYGEYPGNPGGWSQSHQANNRAKIRAYERWLQARDLRHTMICNSSDNGSASNRDAYDNLFKTNSLKLIYTHQQEGGRANRYLFESWYQGPFAVLPETKPGSYANLALHAIKYLKGIRDLAGTPQALSLSLVSTGNVTTVRLRNDGDVPCLPAVVAFESGSPAAAIRYTNASGLDISSLIRTPEGYVHTNMLNPGQATTITVAVAPPATPYATTVNLEAFWNPQDPTGLVRSRVAIPFVSTPPPSPPKLSWTTTSTNTLVLSWPPNYTSYRLQAQTNPISVGLSTNWSEPITTQNPCVIQPGTSNAVFYRLISP